MSEEEEEKSKERSLRIQASIGQIPVLRNLMHITKRIQLPWLNHFSLYNLIEMYVVAIVDGAISYRASSIAFSFFMALFPFALFILNLIPYIPIEGFQQDFMNFVAESVPPNTYDAVSSIINDILHNSYQGLLSSGFILSILLQANGLTAILTGFEASQHVKVKRSIIRQYLVSLGMSMLLTALLIMTIIVILVFEIFLQSNEIHDILGEDVTMLERGRYLFIILMILLGTSILFRFGTMRVLKRKLISVGSVFTTVLFIITSYIFGIWVVDFSKYNELYGSIGTLLIMMFYIWINCMILLLGFELDAVINHLKEKHLIK